MTVAPDRVVVERRALLVAVAAPAQLAQQAMARRNQVEQEARARHSTSPEPLCTTEVVAVVGSTVIRLPCPLGKPVPVA